MKAYGTRASPAALRFGPHIRIKPNSDERPTQMNDNVPATDAPDHFAEIAVELHRVADDMTALVGSGLPKPGHFNLNIQPGGRGDGDATKASVDALGMALTGKPGELQKMSDGTYHYATKDAYRGPISVSVYQSVPTDWVRTYETAAALAAKEAELEKLRAEVAELRAGRSGMDFSQLADRLNTDGAPVPTTAAGYTNGDRSGELVEVHPAEPAARSCRYAALAEVLAAIDQADPENRDELPPCNEPATWSTTVARQQHGQDAEHYTRTCTQHDEQFKADPGYVSSFRLPSTST